MGLWWKIQIPKFKNCEEALVWTWFALEKKTTGQWLLVAFIALLNSIWRLRNKVIFEKKRVFEEKEFR